MRPVFEEVRAWLQKAGSDLLAAQILIRYSELALGPAAFHCQQAAEKTLKAFLISRAVPFDRVHSLVYLLDLCEVEEPTLAALREHTEMLSPYAVEIRYPGDIIEISSEEARQAFAAALAVWDRVLHLIPAELHPQVYEEELP